MRPLRSLILCVLVSGCGSEDRVAPEPDADTVVDTTLVADSVAPETSDTTRDDTAFEAEVDGSDDRDCDGVANVDEAALGTSPDDADSDDDGLPDGLELGRTTVVAGTDCPGFVPDADPGTTTDPTDDDSDGDGLRDGVEDGDHDGLRDAGETGSHTSDGDCDGLGDAVELTTRYAGHRQTDPTDADSDDDGLVDGLERGMTEPVPGSSCTVTLDGQRSTKSDPTSADSDGDGLSDGCEDENHNGVVDLDETDPQAYDTDADGLADAVEDADGDCRQSAGETSGARADTDGDGIIDRVELALGTTDPHDPDSDDDGVPDGAEDHDQDGVVDQDETDPLDDDSDDDGLVDGVEDSDGDGIVDPGESDPRSIDGDRDGIPDTIDPNPSSADGDGDGISDDVEDANRDGVRDAGETDARRADSDGDGADDGAERLAGTDPLDDDDPAAHIATGMGAVCRAEATDRVRLYTDGGGDWTLALPTRLTYAAASTAEGDHLGTFHDHDDDARVAGFVLDRAPIGASLDAATQAQAMVARVTTNMAALGAASVTTAFSGRQATSHDGFAMTVNVQIDVNLNAGVGAGELRNRLIGVLAGRPLDSFGVVPEPGGSTDTRFVVRFAVQLRSGPDWPAARLVVLGALAGIEVYEGETRLVMDDLAIANGLARAHSQASGACAPLTVTGTAKADFIWMADISVSTEDDRGAIVNAAGLIFDGLEQNGVDFRMGVVPSTENRRLDPSSPGQLRSGFTRSQTIFENNLEDDSTTVSEGCEFGLTAIDDAIVRALPRSATESPTKLREDALLVVFYISDETAQEVESSSNCGAPPLPTGQSDTNRSLPPTATQQANIRTIVEPFVDRIRQEGGVAFGQILPIKAPFCDEDESGEGYVEVISALDGSFYRVCDNSPGLVLQLMIDTIAAAAFDLVLSDVPIAETLQVGITRAGAQVTTVVPRSATDGFAYDAVTNAIFFRGSSFRPAFGDLVTVAYRHFTAPGEPEPECTAPLVPDGAGGCACTSDPVSGGCGSDTCGASEVCDGDACGCRCAADCGGVGERYECVREPVCGAVCADADDDGVRDCNMRCDTNFTCTEACVCVCRDLLPGGAHDCNGLIGEGSPAVCNVPTCTAVCPLDCGGCGSGLRCDLATCTCLP